MKFEVSLEGVSFWKSFVDGRNLEFEEDFVVEGKNFFGRRTLLLSSLVWTLFLSWTIFTLVVVAAVSLSQIYSFLLSTSLLMVAIAGFATFSLQLAHHTALFPFAQDSLVRALVGMDHWMHGRCLGDLLG